MNLPPSSIGKGSMLIIPIKKEIIHNQSKNIETWILFHSMMLYTGLYAKELSLIIPINPLSGSSGEGVITTGKSISCSSRRTVTITVSPGIRSAFWKSIGVVISIPLISVMISLGCIPAFSAPDPSINEITNTPSGSS